MRALFFVSIAASFVVACSSSSSSDDGTQDANDDIAGDSMQNDAPPSDSSFETGDDTTNDETGGTGDTEPDVPIDGNTDGGSCGEVGACGAGLTCCGTACRNTHNDPNHCGTCDDVCTGTTPMCLAGHCASPVCSPACGTGTICCEIDGPGPTRFQCVAGTTCPIGCPACK